MNAREIYLKVKATIFTAATDNAPDALLVRVYENAMGNESERVKKCPKRSEPPFKGLSKMAIFANFAAISRSYMVGAEGFEPSAFWSRTKRATRLRYAPKGVLMVDREGLEPPT